MGNCNCLQMQKTQAFSNKLNDFLLEESYATKENKLNFTDENNNKSINIEEDKTDSKNLSKLIIEKNNKNFNNTNLNSSRNNNDNELKMKETRNSLRGMNNPMQNSFKNKGCKDSEISGKDINNININIDKDKFNKDNSGEGNNNDNGNNFDDCGVNGNKKKDVVESFSTKNKDKAFQAANQDSNISEANEKRNRTSAIYTNSTSMNSNSNNAFNSTAIKYIINNNLSTNNNIQFESAALSNPLIVMGERNLNNNNNISSNNQESIINLSNTNNNRNLLNKNLTDILALRKLSKTRSKQRNSINIVFLGDKCTGKTSLAYQYTASKFDQYYIQTIAQEQFSKNVKFEGKNYSLNLTVTSGVPQYQEDYSNLYSEADFLVVCFDLTTSKSFEKAKEIIKNELKVYAFLMQEDFANVVLIGNKSDLSRERKVKIFEINEFCKKYNIQFFETSAKTKQNVQNVFNKIVEVYDKVILC